MPKMKKFVKKSRCARTSPQQYSKMLDFFSKNKGLAEGRFHVQHGKEKTKKKWSELAAELNSMNGVHKTGEQWQSVWRDLKSRTSVKLRELRKATAQTGNLLLTTSELTELEKRVLNIVGVSYVEDDKECVDSIPKEKDIQIELEKNNPRILSNEPQTPPTNESIRDDIHLRQSTSEHSSIAARKTGIRENTSHSLGGIRHKLRREGPTSVDFLRIVKTQADAMTVLAEAAKINALAAAKIGDGISKLGDAAIAQAANNAKQVLVQEKLADAFLKVGDAVAMDHRTNVIQLELMQKMTDVLQNIMPTFLDNAI